jgi:hypothetical protein
MCNEFKDAAVRLGGIRGGSWWHSWMNESNLCGNHEGTQIDSHTFLRGFRSSGRRYRRQRELPRQERRWTGAFKGVQVSKIFRVADARFSSFR